MISERNQEILRLARFTLDVDGRFALVHEGASNDDCAERARELRPGAVVVGSSGSGTATRWTIDRLHRAVPQALIVVLSTARRPGRLELANAQVPVADPGWPHRLVHALAGLALTLDVYAAWPDWERRSAERRRADRRSRPTVDSSRADVSTEQRHAERRSGERRAA